VNLARAQLAGGSADGRRLTIHFEAPADPIVIPIDAAQIEDAVLNLIINAIEATDGDGHVWVRVARSLNDTAGDPQEEATIEVSDNGRGISEPDLGRIFSPFFTSSPGGTGLGLPAVRRVARAHGGRVEVKSSPGQGATFTIHLPTSV
jgi:signal transduction histidine kinase